MDSNRVVLIVGLILLIAAIGIGGLLIYRSTGSKPGSQDATDHGPAMSDTVYSPGSVEYNIMQGITKIGSWNNRKEWQPANFTKMTYDGKAFFVYSQERDRKSFVKTLADLDSMARATVSEIAKKVKRDGAITSMKDDSISKSELDRLNAMFASPKVCPIAGYSNDIVSQDEKSGNGAAGMTPPGGKCVFLSSVGYHRERWTWQNFGYVMHEMAHVALGAPGDESLQHTAEFFRLFYALSQAAARATVWQPDFVKFDSLSLLKEYSTWGWNINDWPKLQNKLTKYHWDGTRLVYGRGVVTPGSGTGVYAMRGPSAPRTRGMRNGQKSKKSRRKSRR